MMWSNHDRVGAVLGGGGAMGVKDPSRQRGEVATGYGSYNIWPRHHPGLVRLLIMRCR